MNDLLFTKIDNTQDEYKQFSDSENGMYIISINQTGTEYTLTDTSDAALNYLKFIKKQEIKNEFQAKYQHSVINSATLNTDIDAGIDALNNVEGLIKVLAADTDTVQFRVADNSFVTASKTQLEAVELEIINAGQTLYKNKWAVESQIDAQTDIDTLKNATINLGNGQLVLPTDSSTTSTTS